MLQQLQHTFEAYAEVFKAQLSLLKLESKLALTSFKWLIILAIISLFLLTSFWLCCLLFLGLLLKLFIHSNVITVGILIIFQAVMLVAFYAAMKYCLKLMSFAKTRKHLQSFTETST